MAVMIGRRYCVPSIPKGINSASAASGPYAALVKRIEPEDGDAGSYSNLLGAFFTRRQRFTKNPVLNRHVDVDTTPVKLSS